MEVGGWGKGAVDFVVEVLLVMLTYFSAVFVSLCYDLTLEPLCQNSYIEEL